MGHGGRASAAAPSGAAAADEDALASDSDGDATAVHADGEGVWEQSFCIVCNCLIEPDADDTADTTRANDSDDGAWEAAAVSMVPIHARARAARRPRRPVPATGAAPRAPLFCSDECRRADEARAAHLTELVHYMSPFTDGVRRTSQPTYAHRSGSLGAAHPLSHSLSAAGAPSAAGAQPMSLRAASLRTAPPVRTPAPRTDADAPAFDAARRVRVPSAASPAMSNLARARQSQPGAPPRGGAPGAHSASPGVSPTTSPRGAARGVAGVSPGSPGTSPRSRLGTSPLGLLPAGLQHRAAPSVSTTDTRAGAARPGATSAAAALRRAHDEYADEPRSLTHVVSALLQRDADAAPPAPAPDARRRRMGDAINARNLEQVPVAINGARPREGSGSDASSTTTASRRSTAERRRSARTRDTHVLPPLLCPPPSSPLSRSFGAASASGGAAPSPGRARTPRSAWGAALSPNVGDAGVLSRSVGHTHGGAHLAPGGVPGTSPRRAGLGWSALAPMHAAEPPTPGARPASVAGSTWRYASRDGDLKMYPILQLPGTDIHDLYSEYWSAPDAVQADGTPAPAPPPDELLARRRAQAPAPAPDARRKSLFHFDA